jgi:hypothetical protein
VCFGNNVLFDSDETTPIGRLTGTDDKRTVYTVCHALFTEVMIAEVLWYAIQQNRIRREEQGEALGRLAFIIKKFEADRENVKSIGELSTIGSFLMGWVGSKGDEIAAESNAIRSGLCLDSQTYNFDQETFARYNPHFKWRRVI